MPRARDANVDKAKEMFDSGMKLIEIASQLNVPEGTVRSWKNRYKWDCNATKGSKCNVAKRKRGGQPGNKNAKGGPAGNKHAEKYGFFSKYLPEETKEIFDAIETANPLDLLWHQIQIAYAAIIRAQKIAYVKDKKDLTERTVMSGDMGDSYSYQEAWDKQGKFMSAQARAQSELARMIKQYDEMLHHDWELATEEQKLRIAVLKSKAKLDDGSETGDDGFLEALQGKVKEIWQE